MSPTSLFFRKSIPFHLTNIHKWCEIHEIHVAVALRKLVNLFPSWKKHKWYGMYQKNNQNLGKSRTSIIRFTTPNLQNLCMQSNRPKTSKQLFLRHLTSHSFNPSVKRCLKTRCGHPHVRTTNARRCPALEVDKAFNIPCLGPAAKNGRKNN